MRRSGSALGGGVLFRVLGPLELDLGDGLLRTPPGFTTRAVLAALLLRPGSVVPVHRLADAVWGERPPANVENSVHVAVGRLRRALGPGGARVLTRAPGYLLDLDGARLDAEVFEATCRAARRTTQDPQAAARLLAEALALWRGPAFGEFANSFAASPAARLERLRVAAGEERADALLRAGALHEAAACAVDLVTEDRLATRPVAVLMQALAGAGRRPEALAAYQQHATALRDELGLDPAPELQDLFSRVLCAAAPAGSGMRPASLTQSLPDRPSTLIGREDELATVAAAIRPGQLVSVVGPGGVGKTRLALELAHRSSAVARAVEWVDLVPVHPSRLVDAVAAATGVELSTGRDPVVALGTALASTHGVLVLDNAEHVLEPLAGLLEHLAEAAPELAILVTSRERLALNHEQVQALPPLPLPIGADATNPAVRLFVERAPTLSPLDENGLTMVGELCQRLDGLPLAIELGAARACTLGLELVHARLGTRLDLLGGGRRTADRRHRTLRAVLTWSHDLLTGEEAVLFRRLGVFPGSFTLDQAESVCPQPSPLRPEVAGLLARLIEQSLVRRIEPDRFQLLETIRAYASEQLAATDEQPRLRAAHAHDTADRLAHTSPQLWTADEPTAVQALTALTPDLHTAWRYAAEHDRPLALGLAANIYYFALYRQRLELLAWGLPILTWSADTPDLAGALGTAACALWAAGRVDEAAAVAARGVNIAGGPDTPAAAIPAQESGTIAIFTGQTDLAVARYQRLAATCRRRNEPTLALLVELGAAHALITNGRRTEAARIVEATLPLADRSANPSIIAWAHYLAAEATAHTAPDQAAAECRTAIAAGKRADSRLFVTLAHGCSAAIAARAGQHREALDAYAHVLDEWVRLGNGGLTGNTLHQIVALLADLRRDHDAAVLSGALAAGHVAGLAEDTDRAQHALEQIRKRLGEQPTTVALNHGAALPERDVIAHARRALRTAR